MTSAGSNNTAANADTVIVPDPQARLSIGRIIPLSTQSVSATDAWGELTLSRSDLITVQPKREGLPRPSERVNKDPGFSLLSLSLLIIATLTLFSRKSISSSFSSISFRRYDTTKASGTSGVLSWPPVLRNAFTIINISLFATFPLQAFGVIFRDGQPGLIILTLILAGIFFAALMTRHLISVMMAGLTGYRSLFREYVSVVYDTWFISAMILFILNGIILFGPFENTLPLIITGLIVIGLLLIIRTLKLMTFFHESHISFLYFILYLCALEILPALVIMKMLSLF